MKLSYNERVALMAYSVPASHDVPGFYVETLRALSTSEMLRHVTLIRFLGSMKEFATRAQR